MYLVMVKTHVGHSFQEQVLDPATTKDMMDIVRNHSHMGYFARRKFIKRLHKMGINRCAYQLHKSMGYTVVVAVAAD